MSLRSTAPLPKSASTAAPTIVAKLIEAHYAQAGPGYAQISSSVGTGLFSMTLPMRETFIRCL